MKGIADTGFLVAFANRNDRHHEWAVRVSERLTEPLLTCEAVLAEAGFHLGDVGLVLRMLREGLVTSTVAAISSNSLRSPPGTPTVARISPTSA